MPLPTDPFLSLEHLLVENDRFVKDPRIFLQIEAFYRAHQDPKEVPRLTTHRIRRIAKVTCHARNDEQAKKGRAQFDIDLYTIAHAYCAEGIQRIEQNRCEEEKFTTQEDKTFAHRHLYELAGNFSFRMGERAPSIEEKRTYLLRAYEQYKRAIRIGESVNATRPVAYTYAFRGSVSKALADLSHTTEKINWFRRAALDTAKSGKRTCKESSYAYNPRHSAIQYSIAAKYNFHAAALARRTPIRQKQLIRSSIAYAVKSKEINPSPHHHASIDYDIGKFSDFLYLVTHNKIDATRAISFYITARDYFRQNPEMKNEYIITTASKRIEILMALIK